MKKITLLSVILFLISDCAHAHLTRIGSEYGGWTIPDDMLSSDSICYCVGAGEDVSFDLGLIRQFSCSVYSFDPTPRSIIHVKCIKESVKNHTQCCTIPNNYPYEISQEGLRKFHFIPTGLWKKNETLKFYTPKNPKHVSHSIVNLQHTAQFIELPCKTLKTIMHEQGHVSIDLLKLDIEGAEYDVLDDMINEKIIPTILCVEFHHAPGEKKEVYVAKLLNAGYQLMHRHGNDITFIRQHRKKLGSMHIREYFVDLFPTDPVTTEYDAYKLLKESPIAAETNYLAVPWAVLINSKKLGTLPEIKLDGGFTVCQHVNYESILPILKTIGIDVLFTPHVKKSKRYEGITVLPIPHAAVHGTLPMMKKDILYSFIGLNNHASRAAIFRLAKAKDIIIKRRNAWHWWNKDKKKQDEEKAEYQNVLGRSRFSLCPRGVGASTLRFWESLQAGAIPVLIADEFMLPPGFDWHKCIIQVPEKEVGQLDARIRALSTTQEQQMRSQCLKAFQAFSGPNFVSVIRHYYA